MQNEDHRYVEDAQSRYEAAVDAMKATDAWDRLQDDDDPAADADELVANPVDDRPRMP